MNAQTSALVVVLSHVESDPRVRRQIDWLTGAGYTVDTLGLGPIPAEVVRDHFALGAVAPWVSSKLGTVLVYSLFPGRQKFKRLVQDRFPAEVSARVARGEYRLIVFNDYDFIPWVADESVFTPAARAAHLHLDLHEYRDETLEITSAWTLLKSRYYKWVRSFIGHRAFTTRTTVASRLGEFYVDDFGIPELGIVRNSPPFIDQEPSEVDPADIRLVFHGMASWARGLREIIDAMKLLDDRFSMTFMFTGSQKVISEVGEYASGMERVRIVPPVPMTELSAVVNQYDLEIMFYSPDSRNLEFALPNKFFEAVQGRLGVIIGESPMMAEIVDEYSNGVIVKGWTATDLAAAISELTPERVAQLKAGAHRAARDLNAEAEGRVFLSIVDAPADDRPAA